MLRLPHLSRDAPDAPSYVHVPMARAALALDAPRVLATLNMGTGWSRGVLRGFMAAAHERRWTVLHYPPPVDFDALVHKFSPSVIVIGPDSGRVPSGHAARIQVAHGNPLRDDIGEDNRDQDRPENACPRVGAVRAFHLPLAACT